ncbi:uncharacterized protein CANTADRAFT_203785 [Suhomyces tanzawaensis NRRL Y-17324]|uniref:Uncharacterized protein n=1 Tax=Suhomyces tanzawaensis NRRL Y-17324 TaxID=984487 RepID=A0A1E4SP51_9ASCO|nr:uncharacterized protein CANTADRAFT_203785 [Suhomyces tanzawaensis NRRL Y-17324]ODV81299.1 hypothetical protein CANTADRAFT_203785 [Suhomyces tanzawaensis NRRL Y-17324]
MPEPSQGRRILPCTATEATKAENQNRCCAKQGSSRDASGLLPKTGPHIARCRFTNRNNPAGPTSPWPLDPATTHPVKLETAMRAVRK